MKNRTFSYSFFLTLFLMSIDSIGQVRSVIDMNKDWKFFLGNDSTASKVVYNDNNWRTLSLPHDWSIEFDFARNAPATNQGGSLPGGIGWYRKTFMLSAKNKNVSVEFDGVYKNSEVWINGHYLGKRPNGYVPFSYDVTNFILPPPQKNVISVKVDNTQQPDSRWYSGSGIYRNVKLVVKNKTAINKDGIFITTPEINAESAMVEVTASMTGDFADHRPFSIVHTIIDNKGSEIVKQKPYSFSFYGPGTALVQKIKIPGPGLWSPGKPELYTLKTQLFKEGKITDEINTVFGIRHFKFDSSKGFFLNGKPMKIHGVCMHHDLGALGSAFNVSAARRQLTILKEMGCNAIRFSHNPPAVEMLDLCDQMGFLVIDEAFDMWQKRKNRFDYHLDFKEWHKKDIEAMVLRDRNHPSVIMWSIGNEIREQFDSTGITITKELVLIVRSLDATRPVTSAVTETFPDKNFITKSNALDIIGFNYKDYDYAELPKRFPGQKFIASETASALATRGVYQFPSESIRIWPPNFKAQDTFTANPDFTSAAYDNTHAYWGNTHERSWLAVKRNPHIAGAFVWSGFDYLGEPMPYPKFPARSSYYGIIDLAGFPKDVYYMYQSEWSTKPVLHIFPHWNWEPAQMVDVWAYYNNGDEVELFLNGRSLGIRRKNDTTLHVMWRTMFEAGTLKAVSRKNGKIVMAKEIRTAGKAVRIVMEADKLNLRAGGNDLSFVTVRIVDKNGNLVPEANNLVEFKVRGNGKVVGTDNGYQADTVSLKSRSRKCWKGVALCIIKGDEKKGNITLTVTSPGILPASIVLRNN